MARAWAPEGAIPFLRWVPEEQWRQSSDPDGASLHYLVHVDGNLRDRYVAENEDRPIGELLDAPASGFYLVHVGDAGQADAEYFGEDGEAAVAAARPWVEDYLDGDDQPLAGGEF